MDLDRLEVFSELAPNWLPVALLHGKNVYGHVEGLSFTVLFMLDNGSDEVGYFVDLAAEGRGERVRLQDINERVTFAESYHVVIDGLWHDKVELPAGRRIR